MPVNPAEQMQHLYARFGHLPGVTIELHKELIAVAVTNKQANATIFLQGAQLSHYQRHGQAPTIWCSPQCDYLAGTPLRGGIPVCWPWFGDACKNPQAIRCQFKATPTTAHGFVRSLPWQLDAIELINDKQTQLVFVLQLDGSENPSWPYPARLVMAFHIGEQLTIDFTVINTSRECFNFSSALHSYFAVGDIQQVAVNGLNQLHYIDCLKDWSLQQQQGELMIQQEVDRIYRGTKQAIQIVDHCWQRSIDISFQGSQSAIVWNPWLKKSQRLSQFAANAYQSMLCIETANAEQDYISLAPSEQHHLQLILNTEPLEFS